MGRKKTAWPNEPPHFCPRLMPSGKILYYYQAAGEKIPLGADRGEALKEWARLEAGTAGPVLFPALAAKYIAEVFPQLKVTSRIHYKIALENLCRVFSAFTLEQIEPKHVKKYIRERSKKGAALFEKRVLSAFYAWARGEGHTAAPNPCSGVKFSTAERRAFGKLGKRDRYVNDAEFDQVNGSEDELIQDITDLGLYTGQRPGDLLGAKRTDIEEDVLFEGRRVRVLWFSQEKTGAQEGVIIEGDLERVLHRILTRQRAVQSIYILCDERGQRVSYGRFNKRFRTARGEADWQFRDIRAKAATDSPDLKTAQRLLGHKSETTTIIYRRKNGNIVAPLKRANSEPI